MTTATSEQGLVTETGPLFVPGREVPPPRSLLPDPTDIVEIAHVAQRFVVRADIPYRYGPTRRLLRIFPGGWWDSDVRRDHEGERRAWL